MTTQPWEREARQAWDELETRLTAWLGDGHDGEGFAIALPWTDDAEGVPPYVAVDVTDGWACAAAASNTVLDATFELDAARCAQLEELGWDATSDPEDEEEDGTNFSALDKLPGRAADVAEMLVSTLRDVYGIPAPSFLAVSGAEACGSFDDEPRPLGLTRAATADDGPDLSVAMPSGPDDLRDLVAEALEPIMDGEIEFDPDGDIPVPAGRTVIFVRVAEDSPSIRLFAPLLLGVRWTPRVGHTLNEANQFLDFTKVVHLNDQVLATEQLSGAPFVAEILRQAVLRLVDLVDGLDVTLQEKIGGNLFSEWVDDEAC